MTWLTPRPGRTLVAPQRKARGDRTRPRRSDEPAPHTPDGTFQPAGAPPEGRAGTRRQRRRGHSRFATLCRRVLTARFAHPQSQTQNTAPYANRRRHQQGLKIRLGLGRLSDRPGDRDPTALLWGGGAIGGSLRRPAGRLSVSGHGRHGVARCASPDSLPPVGVVRTLFTSALVGAGGSARAGFGVARLTLHRTPSLLALSARALAPGSAGARADAEFRDELLTLLDDVAEIAWRQARAAPASSSGIGPARNGWTCPRRRLPGEGVITAGDEVVIDPRRRAPRSRCCVLGSTAGWMAADPELSEALRLGARRASQALPPADGVLLPARRRRAGDRSDGRARRSRSSWSTT